MSNQMQQQDRVIRVAYVDMVSKGEYEYFLDLIGRFAKVEVSNKPDYVFCAEFGTDHLKYSDCVKIFVQGEEGSVDLNEYDYALTLEKIQTYDRCFFFPAYYRKSLRGWFYPVLQKHMHSDGFFMGKRKFCNFIVSNGLADPFREECFYALSEYKHVDSAGRYLNNMGSSQKAGDRCSTDWFQQSTEFRKDYRFSLVFENAKRKGYLTEKLFSPWLAGSIPIYWGDSEASKVCNPDAYIDCTMCTTAQEVVEKVRAIEENPEKYLAMQKAPVALPGSDLLRSPESVDNELSEFFRQIMMQPKENARRRSNGYRARVYHRDQRLLARCQNNILYRVYMKQLRRRNKV